MDQLPIRPSSSQSLWQEIVEFVCVKPLLALPKGSLPKTFVHMLASTYEAIQQISDLAALIQDSNPITEKKATPKRLKCIDTASQTDTHRNYSLPPE